METSSWFSCQNNIIFFVDKYEHPTYPGALNIPYRNPHITALTIRDNHKKYISIFMQIVDVDTLLKKQDVAAIDKLYIK